MDQFFAVRATPRPDNDASVTWRKSSFSGYNANCIEVANMRVDTIGIRDSKNPRGAVLNFTASEWGAFIGGIRHGEFDQKTNSV